MPTNINDDTIAAQWAAFRRAASLDGQFRPGLVAYMKIVFFCGARAYDKIVSETLVTTEQGGGAYTLHPEAIPALKQELADFQKDLATGLRPI